MSYNSTNEVYTLDRNDYLRAVLQVCDNMNYIGFTTKYGSTSSASHYVSIAHFVFGLH